MLAKTQTTMRLKTRIFYGGAAVLVGATITGCAGPSSPAELPAPVIIVEDQQSAECRVGETVVVVIPDEDIPETVVESSDDSLITITQAHFDGSASFNAGGTCLKPGEVTLSVVSPEGQTREIALTISPE